MCALRINSSKTIFPLHSLSAAFTALIFSAAWPIVAANKQDDTIRQGFHLIQKSERAGQIDVLICQHLIKFDNKVNATSSIIDADARKVLILNHESKKYFAGDLDRWSPSTNYMTSVLHYSDYSDLRPAETEKLTYLNFPAQKEIQRNPQKFATPGTTKAERLILVSSEIISCPLLTDNKTLIQAAKKYYLISPSKAFPLTFQSTSRKGTINKLLKTTLLEKQKIDLKSFSKPASYTSVKDQNEIYIDSAGADTLKDMLTR